MSRITFIPAKNKRPDLIARNPIFRAMAPKTMAVNCQTDLSLPTRIAFESTQRGTANDVDRDTLVCMVNVSMVLAEKHCSEADLDATLEAQDALLRADSRVLLGKPWNFDGPGRTAMLHALSIHEQLIAQLGRVALSDALIEVQTRRLRGQVHKVSLKS